MYLCRRRKMKRNMLRLVMTRNVAYKQHRTERRTGHCETARHSERCEKDGEPNMLICWCLSENFYLNHRRAVAEITVSENFYLNHRRAVAEMAQCP